MLNISMNMTAVQQKQIHVSPLVNVMAWCDGQPEPTLTPIVVTARRHYAIKG